MKQIKMEGIDSPLSRLVYGTGTSILSGEDKEAAFACLDMAWDAGFRVFDTAHRYGNAEEHLGEWLYKRGIRNKAVILDKGCNPGEHGSKDIFSADTIREQITESLRRLKTEKVELYILHRDDETKPVDEIVEVLNEYKEKGVISKFGGSNWRLPRILQANEYARKHGLTSFEVLSPCFSLAEFADPWGGSVCMSQKKNRDLRKWAEEKQLPVFNYSALARGFLSGKYRTDDKKAIEDCLYWGTIAGYDCPKNRERLHRAEQLAEKKGCSVSQICLAWLFAQKMQLFPIVSPTKEEHMKDNIKALQVELNPEEVNWLEDIEDRV